MISCERKECIFYSVYFVRRNIFQHLRFISMYSALNKLPEYTYFYILKNLALYTFLLVFKIAESLECISLILPIFSGETSLKVYKKFLGKRMQRQIQNSIKHLRWGISQEQLITLNRKLNLQRAPS